MGMNQTVLLIVAVAFSTVLLIGYLITPQTKDEGPAFEPSFTSAPAAAR